MCFRRCYESLGIHGTCTTPLGLPKEKSVRLGFLGTAGPYDDRLRLRRIRSLESLPIYLPLENLHTFL